MLPQCSAIPGPDHDPAATPKRRRRTAITRVTAYPAGDGVSPLVPGQQRRNPDDRAVEISNRDVIILFGYRSDTEFSYAHLSTDNTIYPHNGIFVVNNADRLRIDDQWNEDRSRAGLVQQYVDGAHRCRSSHRPPHPAHWNPH